MSRLIWSNPEPSYENGIEYGAFYLPNKPGLVWNGLISVEETFAGGEVEALFYDGLKYYDFVNRRYFKANVQAVTIPPLLGPALGEVSIKPGFIATKQHRQLVGLSYVTNVGREGKKIHLIYNATLSRKGLSYSTRNNTPEPVLHNFELDAKPERGQGWLPTAKLVVVEDRIEPWRIQNLRNILWGDENNDPYFPTQNEVRYILGFGGDPE